MSCAPLFQNQNRGAHDVAVTSGSGRAGRIRPGARRGQRWETAIRESSASTASSGGTFPAIR